jgi:hypothetical protein
MRPASPPPWIVFAAALAVPCATQINSIEARKLMRQPVLSVMDKAEPGPSGDKHDFVSYAPYWWPDPNQPDGLPYIRKDGHTNRELVAKGDANNFASTARTIRLLANAFVTMGEPEYADNAIRRIAVWFLNPATRMNPHLNYGQGVPGRTQGRAEGLVTMRHLIDILDAVRDLRAGKAWPPVEDKALREWMSAYYAWLTSSPLGLEEAGRKNNHGSWLAAQAMSIELYLGMKSQASKRAHALKVRIAAQIEPDGSQPLEAAREDGFGYSVFNLEALAQAAVLAKPLGVDLWKHRTSDGRGLRAAFQYLQPYASGAKPWPGKQLKKIEPDSLAKVRELYDRVN